MENKKTEIDKLYENAGVEKKRMCKWTCRGNEFCSTNCEHYESTKEFYPPFTAEKQLELIKWLVRNQDIFKITYHREFLWCSGVEWVESGCYEEFEESLADLLNNLWQSLTEEEKEQIRSVLK